MKLLPVLRCCLILIILSTTHAYSIENNTNTLVSWTPLPPACLPERAVKWDTRLTNPEDQAACHCPPIEYCPTTYEEYSDNTKAKMPMGFVLQCCPVIPAPEKCPDGSIKEPGKACPDMSALCPVKYYPSLAEAGITMGSSYTSRYIGENNKSYFFVTAIPGARSAVERIPTLFDWSLRLIPMDMGTYAWVHSNLGCALIGSGGGFGFPTTPTICAEEGYKKLGNIYGTYTFQQIVSVIGQNAATWFGLSVAKIDRLPNNLANPVLNETYTKNGVNFIQIGNYGYNTFNQTFNNSNLESPRIGLSTYHSSFINTCRSVAGEYVTIEHHDRTVNGMKISCPYLQCRYVYESEYESCVTGDTKVKMADGSDKEIKDLKVNDTVIGEDGKAGKVQAMNHYQSELRVLYSINGSTSMITGDHPIKTDKGWKVIDEAAAKTYSSKDGFVPEPLKVNDKIITLDGVMEVKSIDRKPAFNAVDTYNLKIKDNGSFTANGMIVKGFDKMEIKY